MMNRLSICTVWLVTISAGFASVCLAQAPAIPGPAAPPAPASVYNVTPVQPDNSPMGRLTAYRMAIKHGVVRFRTKVHIAKSQRLSYTNVSHQYDMTFDGSSIRCDHARHAELKGRMQNFLERRIVTPTGYIHQNVDQNTGVDYGPLQNVTWFAADDIFEPRLFGLVPVPIAVLKRFSFDEMGISMGSVVPGKVVNGEQTYEMQPGKVSQQDASGVKLTLVEWGGGKAWFNPEHGFALERLETNDGHQKLSIVASYAEFPGNIWFPAQLEYKDERGGQLFHHEETTVEADFATSVPRSKFTVAGLNLPAGTLVTNFTKTEIWDGTKLIPARAGTKQRKKVEPGRAWWMRPPYGARTIARLEQAAGREIPVSIREKEPPQEVQTRIAAAEKGEPLKPAPPAPAAEVALAKRGKTPEPEGHPYLYYGGIITAIVALAGALIWRRARG